MKEQLRQIYADLASGKLSRDEALERIRNLKLQEHGHAAGTLLIAPSWVDGAETSGSAGEYAEHHVLLCGQSASDAETLRFLLPKSRCVSLQVEHGGDLAARYSEPVVACFEHLQSILQVRPQGDVLVQVVVPGDGEQALLAGVSGLLRTAELENPRIAGQVLLVPGELTAEELARALESEQRRGREALVKYENGRRLVWRWQELEAEGGEPPVAFRNGGVYLITGGRGGVGRLFAEEIRRQAPGARVVLAGRSAENDRQADVTDREQVVQLISSIYKDHGRLDGILHCAGILADEFLLKKSADELRRVLAPKVAGAVYLDEATRDLELDFFVLFSSFAGAMGNPGQCDYAAANAFLDHFAAYRNRLVGAGQRHGRTRSIDWPLWQDGGMAMNDATRDALREATGIEPMRTATGLAAFHRCLALPHDQVLVAEGDLARLRRSLLTGRPSQPEVPATAAAAQPATDDLHERTQDFLRAELSELLKLPPRKIDPRAALERYGIDSILAMKLTAQLEKTFGTLSKTLFFEYQTLEELARYFVESHAARLSALFASGENESAQPAAEHEPKRAAGRRSARPRAAAAKSDPEPIAIVGLSGRYPEAIDLDAYWRNLRDGKDCIVEIPKERWDWRAWFSGDRTESGRHYSKWGGFISGVDEFDPLFFNISPKDAKYIDPQERLFLQHAWMAIEDAGYTRAALQLPHEDDLPGQVGVYAGVMYSEYQLVGAESTLKGKPVGVANSTASIANRVSYALNLHGPSMTVDTMCSSSLTAIHLACQDLRLGRTNLAIAGGVNVTIHPNKYLVLSTGQFISSDGHCQSFGEGGDGYIPGEGVGVVVLKRLSDAERDGDHIYAIIRGSALNHGGKTNGYTVPNPQAQAAAIGRALAEARVDARHISYLEAHGTGTKLGDPIEIAALGKAFGRYTQDRQFCLLGSAKSNIGHCESAAGIAGLTKVLLQLKHRQIVPSLHSATLNPHIDFASTPFVVNQNLRPWEQPVVDGRTLPRIAGISSFGAGGSNAHLIVEEYVAPEARRTAAGPVAIVLSARTPDPLQRKAADLLLFVRAHRDALDLESLAWTLQVGREEMDERLGFVVHSIDALAAKLEHFLAGRLDGMHRDDVKRNRESLGNETADTRNLDKLLALWVKGIDVDWGRLYGDAKPRRMSLPTYPFAKERYWIDVPPVAAQTASDLSPAQAAYLEMARAAVAEAAGTTLVELRDVAWAEPVTIPANTPVQVTLLPEGERIDFEIHSDDVVHCQGRAFPNRDVAPAAPPDEAGVFSIDLADAQALERLRQEPSLRVLLVRGFARGADAALRQALLSFPYPTIAVLRDDAVDASFAAAALCDFMVCSEEARYGYTSPDANDLALLSERFGAVLAHALLFHSEPATGRDLRAKGWTGPIVPAGQVETHARQLAAALVTKSPDALRLLKQHLTRGLDVTPAAASATENESSTPTMITPAEHIRVTTPADRVLALTCGIADAKDIVAGLARIFGELRRDTYYKAVILGSDDPELLFAVPDDVAREAQRLIVDAKIPVVAALTRNAKGNAFLIAQACDACVCSRGGVYSAANLRPVLAQPAVALLSHRLGNDVAGELLLTGAEYTGSELRERVPALRVAERDRVFATALELAARWAKLPRTTLVQWKAETAAALHEQTRSLPDALWEQAEDAPAAETAPVTVPLQSRVVTLTAHPDGVAVLEMADREAKNMFSDAFRGGVAEAFAHIAATPRYKAVVLTGFDSYFASGGTKESLLAIQQGKAKFTDYDVHQLALDCKLPVVAAIQGHAIGAGWPMGMLADLVVLSEESQYLSPYMGYGFTPGAGATWVLPAKLGRDLAHESLFTAQPATGRELRERGLAVRVLPRAEVLGAAMQLAREIARSSRARLIALKEQLTANVRETLQETYGLELAMHEQTFVGRADTLARIERTFHQEQAAPVLLPIAAKADDGETLRAVSATLRTLLANELQLRESDVDEHAQFVDLGLDSISGVTWVRRINEKYGTSIEATSVYSYPTLAQLSRFVKEEAEKQGTLSPQQPVALPAPQPPAVTVLPPATTRTLTSWRKGASARSTAPRRADDAIAIVGIAGQFPQAKNVDDFWQNIAQGKNCITKVPAERWDASAWYQPGDSVPGKTYSQWVGALEDYDRFDPLFFNISPRDAESMDPQQRLFLQACWHAIEHAGYDTRALSGTKCGVFAGCAYGDYHLLSRDQQLSGAGFTGDATSILAGRVSYVLNLQGPCLSIDTACSSSLVAIAHACDSLVSGASDLALAGGVYVMAGPEMHVKTAQVGMLSPDGRCFTFDQRANGIVPGEAVGAVLLKRLADAERDGDTIHAVIHGWGVNQDGKTNGITAPNTESQARLEQDVYERFHIDPANIQLIEAHGTGTKLGDPIEINALKKAFAQYTRNEQFCAIGSVKSNIGHCLTAAGIAGVAKLVMALRHRQLPPTINFERLNEHIALDGSPFYVNTRLQEWQAGPAQRRLAAISSFGFSGTNAHLVLGEYVPAPVAKPAVFVLTQNGKVVVPLSARTAAQLKEKAADLLAFVRRQKQSLDLHELAYTLQVGREPMDERLGILAGSLDELAQKLEGWIDGRSDVADVWQAHVKRSRESIAVIAQDDEMREVVVEKCLAGRKLSRLLELWVKGLEVDWNRLYGETRPRRIPLPLYPFAKERYWIDVKPVVAAPSATATAVLHPLLHSNASDLGGQRYRSTLAPEELSAVACLEMARAAVVHASPERPENAVVELHDVAWPAPLTAKGEVTIALAENDEGEIEFEISSDSSDTVHCHGRAVLTEQPVPAADAQNLIALKRIETTGELALYPSVLEAALDAAGLRAPLALATLRVFAPCGPEMSVRVRPAGDAIDLELCDRRGNVAAQLQGLEATRREVVARPVVAAAPLPVLVPAERKKPAISLAAPGAAVGTAAVRPRPSITLAAPAAISSVQLHDEGNGVFAVDLAHAGDVRQALERARQESSLKVLLLHGLDRGCDPALYQPLVSFPYPTIAVLERDAAGTGFLAAALCDFMVCSEEASYAFANPTPAVARVFTERFGAALAQRFLSRGTATTGRELREQGCACPCAPRNEVRAHARAIASTLATKSRDAIRILKGHLARHIAALASELTTSEAAAPVAGPVEVSRFREAAELIARLQQPVDAGALVLAGDAWTFADDAVAELQRLLLDSEVPIVAALAGDVKGNGWLVAQLCDAAVYDRNGVYSAAGSGPMQTATAAFLHRFGSAAAGELLLSGAESSGADLLRRIGTIEIADRDDVVAAATRVAGSWAKLPRATVAAWKQQLRDAIRNMPAPVHDGELPELPPDVPTKIALRSTAVTATAHPEGILVVAMEDREAKNMFSDAFVEGVAEAFAHAARTPAYKVVVLTGFDSYFASGGTKEGLVAIQQGKVKFTDVDVHQMALDCRLPVVAAMQGHGIGAGWCLGMFADVALLSEESRYVSPYMEYGFTPGAGATFILADRIGQDLARESLLTARQITGSELKARGLRLPVLPRAEVVDAAMEIARQIARAPRGRLLALKQLLAAHVRQALPDTYRRELAMHEQTFVGQSDTLAQIQSKFAPELEKPQAAVSVHASAASGDSDVLRAVTASLRALLAKELHLRESDVEDDAEFVSLGLDSISAVTFVRAINEKYKTSIEATKIYRFPTLAQLAAFVKEEAAKHGALPAVAVAAPPRVVVDIPAQPKIAIKPGASRLTSGRRTRRSAKPEATAPAPAQPREAIAVIGMSGRFPQAQNLDEYWRNLEAGRNSITEVPPDRWDVRQYDRARWLGVLDDVDRFDPLFFRIAPQEAEYMDPQHRLFLQESYRAFEDAGYAGRDLSDRKCGVYLGMSINDYAMLLLKRGIQTTPVTANSFAVAAARIAYYLNLKGPAITVDTACSSSLVAIHLACQSLLSGETDMALAGGVTLWLTPESHLSMSEAGMLSAEGQCKAFDDSADGIVVSEGVGALVLKRLKDAEADGDVIHGVILGSGINQDGRTNGITAPSVNSQIELERSIYAKFGIDPATISYVEAHGTGTKLGDPIELEALATAFREKTDKKNYCAIGSVKSNIGHTASAAGVASVLKVLLSLRHRTLVPTLHVTKENSHFDFASSPFYVCREKQAWEPVPGSRRRAAVSSFGYSGTNSHLVLEEYVPSADRQSAANGPYLVPLSARTADQLQQKARELAERLRATPDIDLQSVAYTLQVGRDAMDERAAFLAGSVEELIEKLAAFAEGGKGIEHAWQGRVEAAGDSMALIGRDDDIQEAVDKWIARGKLAKLAELWSRGLNFDWQKLWGAARPRRASLPTYPFAKDRYWIDKVTASGPAPADTLANIVGMGSIEEILGRIDGGAMETERAVRLLRMLV